MHYHYYLQDLSRFHSNASNTQTFQSITLHARPSRSFLWCGSYFIWFFHISFAVYFYFNISPLSPISYFQCMIFALKFIEIAFITIIILQLKLTLQLRFNWMPLNINANVCECASACDGNFAKSQSNLFDFELIS